MAVEPVKVAVVGCGNISDIYLKANQRFEALEIVACADLIPERAEEKAKAHGIAKACSVGEILADGQIEFVVNLTVPKAHAEVNLAAVEAGKSVYTEKPFAVTRQDGRKTVSLAAEKGVRVGGAPDTFLGGGLQTCRKLIDDGEIGEPVAATAFLLGHGPEGWHPDPEFYYEAGGGPMLDMGPYYLTAMVALMGPVRRVTGSARISFPQRTITSKKKHGKVIDVEVPTHVAGVMDFACGAVGTIVTSFDVWAHSLPRIEIYGTEGTLFVPDPNTFGGPVFVQRAGGEKTEVPLTHGYAANSRGLGPADMATAMRTGRKHRANGDLAFHVLDVMHGFHDASDTGRHIQVESTCERPADLPADMPDGVLDE